MHTKCVISKSSSRQNNLEALNSTFHFSRRNWSTVPNTTECTVPYSKYSVSTHDFYYVLTTGFDCNYNQVTK